MDEAAETSRRNRGRSHETPLQPRLSQGRTSSASAHLSAASGRGTLTRQQRRRADSAVRPVSAKERPHVSILTTIVTSRLPSSWPVPLPMPMTRPSTPFIPAHASRLPCWVPQTLCTTWSPALCRESAESRPLSFAALPATLLLRSAPLSNSPADACGSCRKWKTGERASC